MGDWFRAFQALDTRVYILRPELVGLALNKAFSLDRDEFRRDGRTGRQPRRPRLHPTKGYRGAHKLFRGGSR